LIAVRQVIVGVEDVGAPGWVRSDSARFLRRFRMNLVNSQQAGTTKTSHGIIATITVISAATLSARIDPDSRKASPIGVKNPTPRTDSSTWNVISTATFSVSFARIFRWAVSLSNCDWTSVNCRWISTKSFTPAEGFANIVRKLSLKLVRFLILASVSMTTVVLSSLSVVCCTIFPCVST
jgi:hypothetical protein